EAGTVDTTTLEVYLTRPAGSLATISLDCAPEENLTCPESVELDVGEQSAIVPLTGVAASDTAATITATLGNDSDIAEVVVYDDDSTRRVVDLSPATLLLTTQATGELTLTLNLPAPTADVEVPITSSGLVTPETPVTFSTGERLKVFEVTAGDTEGDDTVVATLEGTATAVVTVSALSVDTNLYFSQYMEGSSYNKIVEIYSAHPDAVALDTCQVRVYSNGDTAPNYTIGLDAVTFEQGDLFVLCHSSVSIDSGGACDQKSGSLQHNGNDAVELVCGGETLDVIGQIGDDPGDAWGTGITTKDSNLSRMCSVVQGDNDGSDAFDPSEEWEAGVKDDPADLGLYTCP
ncbi:MAG: hypothetical protein JRJ84_25915, partial [Deltaproteobacteria bacterium]|nr:hypothetical protein [Deltaproteobacteria bacterium]